MIENFNQLDKTAESKFFIYKRQEEETSFPFVSFIVWKHYWKLNSSF